MAGNLVVKTIKVTAANERESHGTSYSACHGTGRSREDGIEDMHVNEVSVVSSAMKVHSELGPGLLESAYRNCLAVELRKRGMRMDIEVPQPVVYDGVKLDFGIGTICWWVAL
jgi:hypothetical protein